jgi:hypothetical protein
VADPVIVAVHLNVNTSVDVIDAGTCLTVAITDTGVFPFTCTAAKTATIT